MAEQKEKAEAKKEEIEKAREELAQKLATTAVKDVDLDATNDTLEKYATLSQNNDTLDDKIEATAGLAQVEDKVKSPESTATTASAEVKKKKIFGKNK